MEDRSKDGYSWEEYREAEHEGVGLGKPEPTWGQIWWEFTQTTRRVFINTSGAKGIWGKTWACCWAGAGAWGHRVWRRLRYQTSPSSQSLWQGWLQEPKAPETQGVLFVVEWDQVREHLNQTYKGPWAVVGLCTRLLPDFSVRPLSITLEWPWSLGEAPEDWGKQMSFLCSKRAGRRTQGATASHPVHCTHPGWSTWSAFREELSCLFLLLYF